MINAYHCLAYGGASHHISLKKPECCDRRNTPGQNSPRRILRVSKRLNVRFESSSASLCDSKPRAPCHNVMSQRPTDAPPIRQQQTMPRRCNPLSLKKLWYGSLLIGAKGQAKERRACLTMTLEKRDITGWAAPIRTTSVAESTLTSTGTKAQAHHHRGLRPLATAPFEHRYCGGTGCSPILLNIRENWTPTSSLKTTDWHAMQEEQTKQTS
jgi:hypothetical protein